MGIGGTHLVHQTNNLYNKSIRPSMVSAICVIFQTRTTQRTTRFVKVSHRFPIEFNRSNRLMIKRRLQ
jgi:hypothetical protein